MFKKARDQLMQTVGLSERMPSNPQLTQSAEKLKQINSLIAAMRKSVESYASSMLAMGDASRILASDISRFYRDSSARTKTVGLFTSAMVDQESNVLFLFKEQFGWDVSREFDQWMAQSHSFRNRVDAIDNEYSQLNAIHVDARTFAAKRDQLDQAAKALSVEISRFVDARYARFDKIFIRLMEFQKEFFHEGVEVTDKFDPVVKQYRNKVSLSGGATPAAAAPPAAAAVASNATSESASASVSNGYNVPSTSASPSPSSTTSPTHVSGERFSASGSPVAPVATTQPTIQKPTSAPTPVAAPTPSSASISTPTHPAPSSSFDILGLSSPASPSASQAPPTKASGNVEIDLFGGLFSSPSQTASAPLPASSSNVSSSFDILGMNTAAASSFSSRTSSTSSSFDFSSFATNSTSAPTASKTASSTGFDADFFSSTTASSSMTKTKTTVSSVSTLSTSIPASSSIDDIDDHVAPSKPSAAKSPSGLDDDMLSGFTYASSSNSNSTGDSSFDMFDPLSSNSIMSNSNPTSVSTFQHQDLPRGAEMSEAEEQNAIHEALSSIEPMIHNWRFKNGMEKEVPGLLASLTTVLWEGHNWKKVDITNLLEYNSVKKSYRRALLTVHPDKVAGSTPVVKATAERVFEVLNNAFKQYEIKMGMRSAN